MQYPKFSIGEDVIIYSIYIAEAQGIEAIVTHREYANGFNTLGYIGWVYTTDADATLPFCNKGGFWIEASLRKRPADFSFDELMNNLKKPVEEECEA